MAAIASSLASRVVDCLAGGFTQNRRILRLATPLGEEALLAECLCGDEEISKGFRLQVSALSLDAAIPLKSLLGQPVLLELLTDERAGTQRPFHGHVTAAELKGANGGFARYHLTIEPWTAFLRYGRDSRIFQDQTVFDILDTVFQAWQGKGLLAPAWRFDVRDRGIYCKRSVTTQYQESDLTFVERLISEEGLFYFFEHAGDATSASLGSHTLVIADHNGAFAANAQADVRYTQPGQVMEEDSIDRWRTEVRMQANAIELSTWDYRTCQVRTVASAGQDSDTLISRDVPGVYVFPTREQGQRMADNHLQSLQARKQVHVGAGTVRTLAPATTFTLHEHSIYDGGDDATFAIVRVRHLVHNNLDADTDNSLTRLLGECPLRQASSAELGSSLHASRRRPGDRPTYRNRIDAIPSSVPYRAPRTDSRGHLLYPRPLVCGQQTAIVVGPPGAVIHTDRDHRIKVQFHWQRGDASHSRLTHPSPDGHTGAPANGQSGVWLRVATPLAPVAGANWGSHALPRVGQEVLVDFMEGDPDRPVVIGTLYNGAGQADAQYNRAAVGPGATTGNAPMWFPGEEGGHVHPAVLSGIKSQSMQASQAGDGAFSQLVFDDTPAQARVALQHHARPHRGTAELNLGHLRHQTDNQRLATVGLGAELKTENSTAVRAGRGLLLATDRGAPAGAHLDSREAASQIEQSAQLASTLASTAQKQNALLPGEGQPDDLPALTGMRRSVEVVQAAGEGAASGGASRGSATAYAEPHLQLSTPAGIAAVTPASAHFSAGSASFVGAGQAINFVSAANWLHSVKSGISLFTYGKAGNANNPVTETGIRLHAATGKVTTQSQDGPTRLTADKAITVASVTKSVTVGAREHVLLTAQGAGIKLSGGNIELQGPGKIEFKASMKELAGPQASHFEGHEFPTTALKPNRLVIERRYHDDEPLAGAQYEVQFPDGSKRSGTLDGAGRATLDDVPAGAAEIRFGAMPGKWERKDQTPTPNHNPKPSEADIERLIDKYAPEKAGNE
jgi:type VI secretion system VgrG family protein